MLNRRRSQKRASVLLLITLLLSVMVALVPVFTTRAVTVGAGQSIAVTGLGADDATITDINGKDVTHTPNLSKYNTYTLNYHWQIPDKVTVKSGDTATIKLPTTVVPQADVNFAVVDPTTDATIGNFFAKAGSSSGLLTFTDFFSHSTVGRQGILTFMVRGRYDDSNNDHPGWYIAKAGWIVNAPANATPEEKAQYVDSLGRPKIFQWEITVNPNMNHVDNVVLTDTLSAGQTFDTSRGIVVQTGTYDNQSGHNWFHATGKITPSYQVKGDQLKISLGNITTAIQVDLWTNPTSVSFDTTDAWTNSVVASGKQGGTGAPAEASGKITWKNSGSGTGQVGQVTLIKQDQKNEHDTLPGAVFSLYRADGSLVRAGFTTDANGQFTVRQLLVGQYHFVETKAPKGYELNPTPVSFTITEKNPHVTVKARDPQVTPPPVTPSKPSSTSSSSMVPPSEPSSSSSVTPPSKPSTPPSKPSKPSKPSTPPSKPSTPSTHPSKPSRPSKPSTTPSKPSEPSSSVTPPSEPSSSSSSVTPPSEPSSSIHKPSKPSASTSIPRPRESSSYSSTSTMIASASRSGKDPSASIEVITPSHSTYLLPKTGERILGWLAIALGSILSLTGAFFLIKYHE